MPTLGVNIDHVATLRQARGESHPNPIQAALICEQAGAQSIVAHLREDRRHINDNDIDQLRRKITTRFNLEMSINPRIVTIATKIKPDEATLVPERRQELTTEGGLNVIQNFQSIKNVVKKLNKAGIPVSLFIAPVKDQIKKAKETGADIIEIHTGEYANAKTVFAMKRELTRIKHAAEFAKRIKLSVNAGHGLNYANTKAIAQIPGMEELNIGHSIISRAVFVGLPQAVKEMLKLIGIER